MFARIRIRIRIHKMCCICTTNILATAIIMEADAMYAGISYRRIFDMRDVVVDVFIVYRTLYDF